MSATGRLQQLATESAERRVRHDLQARVFTPSLRRRQAVVAVAAILFAATFVVRLAVSDPSTLIANFYTVPIALLAVEFGLWAGLASAALALLLVYAWGAVETVDVGPLGYASRGAAFLCVGGLVGHYAERLRRDIAARQRAQHELALHTDELERSNTRLAQSVVRLEAYAAIARAVGGETDLDRVLELILEHGREIAMARGLLVCLRERDELRVVTSSALASPDAPDTLGLDTLAGEVLGSRRPRRVTADENAIALEQLSPGARDAVLVPLTYRGETLGVLVGIDHVGSGTFAEGDEQLLLSVAASAATAVATARSVAADRLRLSIDASEQARERWARELHDDTLQGLGGVRMVLSAALDRDDPTTLERAVEAAHDHLGVEVQRLRELITELRPAALDDLGLGPAIDSLADRQASAAGFAVQVEVALRGIRLSRDTESAIYRLVQEALTNAAKHARPEHVLVRVRQNSAVVTVRVEDDGCGFEPAAVHEGFGLVGMRERAVLAGGHLSVESTPGGPTRVRAEFPLAAQLAG